MSRCGECTLCCRLLESQELQKPINTWCEHCDIGIGCRIHEQRPISCRNFFCYWYLNNKLSDSLRPDKCNVVFELFGPTRIYFALVNPDTPDAWREPEIFTLITNLLRSNVSIFVSTGKGKPDHILLPEGKTIEVVMQEFNDYVKKFYAKGT